MDGNIDICIDSGMKAVHEEPETGRGVRILNVFIDARACNIYHA